MENSNFMFGNIDEAIEHFQRNDKPQEQGPELFKSESGGIYAEAHSLVIPEATVLSGFNFLIRSVVSNPDKYRGLEISLTEQLNGNTYFNLKVNR